MKVFDTKKIAQIRIIFLFVFVFKNNISDIFLNSNSIAPHQVWVLVQAF